MAAAHESREHATRAQSHTVGETTMDDLYTDTRRLARDYMHRPLVSLFGEAQALRSVVVSLVDENRRPRQMIDLYARAGELTGLMASASFDLGYLEAADSLARSTLSYADLAGHTGMAAWAQGTRALIANWQARPSHALRHLEHAVAISPPGTPLLRLRSIEARSRALLRDTEGTAAAIREAEHTRDSEHDDELHDEVGGEFGFDPARQAFCAGTAYLHLEDGAHAAEYAQTSVRLYESVPEDRERSYVYEHRARVDLAAARLLLGDLDAAAEAMAPLWDAPPHARLFVITDRLASVRRMLTGTPFHGVHAAAALGNTIEDWCAESTAVRALPPGSATT